MRHILFLMIKNLSLYLHANIKFNAYNHIGNQIEISLFWICISLLVLQCQLNPQLLVLLILIQWNSFDTHAEEYPNELLQ